MLIRAGYEITYDCPTPTPMNLLLSVRPERLHDLVTMQRITASGPPLPVLLRSLEVLRDLRLAADRRDITTRHDDLGRLRLAVKPAMNAVEPKSR